MYSNDDIGEIIEHRQHFPFGSIPIINLITKHLPLPKKTDKHYWDTLIYFSQISQAMATKTETETYRFVMKNIRILHLSNKTFNFHRVGRYFDWRTMGALYWQLNDVWAAPSWSSIEYNGNFKILHYWAKEFFAPIHVVANIDVLNNLNVFVVRDTLGQPLSLNLNMRIYNWSNLKPVLQQNFVVSMVRNYVYFFNMN